MKLEPILQEPHSRQHFTELVRAVRGAGSDSDFRALVAFVRTVKLTGRFWDAVEEYCGRGGRLDWIVGTDLGGTDGASLARLLRLQERFPANRVRIMKLRGGSVYHPKLYWLSSPKGIVAVLGSANCTGGGLSGNLELSVVVQVSRRDKTYSRIEGALTRVWDSVDQLRGRLRTARLFPLDDDLVARLERYRGKVLAARARQPTHPLRATDRPTRSRSRQGPSAGRIRGQTLAMELTREQGEARKTQVQPPRGVWEGYFGLNLKLKRPGVLALRREGTREPYRRRKVVPHHHVWTVELAGSDVARPAIVRVRRRGARRYTYRVFTRHDRGYSSLRRLLGHGFNPRRKAGRRWIVF